MGENIRNRNLGEVYTPEHIVELLKNEATKYLGEDFLNKYAIWDCCCGTFNLTKGLDKKEDLFCSTLRAQDIRKNRAENGEKFVYDFLNDDIEQLESLQSMWCAEHDKLPKRLVEILQNEDEKPLLFYINPPFASTAVFGANNTDTREGNSSSEVNSLMRNNRMGTSSDQLYCQFLYRILKMKQSYPNKKIDIALISPPQYLTVSTYTRFRDVFLSEFKFKGGSLFRADEFKGLSNRWGISITIWEAGQTENKNEFKLHTYGKGLTNSFEHTGYKVMYNIDGYRNGVDYIKATNLDTDKVDAEVTMSCGSVVSNKKRVQWDKNGIGYLFYKGNNVYHNCTELGILSVPYGDGGGITITKENCLDVLAIFASRALIGIYDRDWKTDKDEYLEPDIRCEAYKKLKANSVILALFNENTHFSSTVQKVENKTVEIINHFHFLDSYETMKMYEENNMSIPKGISDRYIVNVLNDVISSGLVLDSGLKVLEYAKKLFRETLLDREDYNNTEDGAKYQCTRWDAGYYQLKFMWKKLFKEENEKLRLIYKRFAYELTDLVYQCGFLKHRPLDLELKEILTRGEKKTVLNPIDFNINVEDLLKLSPSDDEDSDELENLEHDPIEDMLEE